MIQRSILFLILITITCSPSFCEPKVSTQKPTLTDISYGPYKRNSLDVYLSKSDKPTPVVIYFHGGGFLEGDKSSASSKSMGLLPLCLANSITFIAANYRYVTQAPFPAMMEDGARVVQFVRSKAKEWNIDPSKIALSGASAGGNMSCWLAVQNDMADPNNTDPIKRYSTRVSCVVGAGAQTTNDVLLGWKELYMGKEMHPCIWKFYGIKDLNELKTPEKVVMAKKASAINFVTKDDPPMFLAYTFPTRPTPLPDNTSINEVIHNPWFGKIMKEKMDAVGVECIVRSGDNPPKKDEIKNFLFKYLKN